MLIADNSSIIQLIFNTKQQLPFPFAGLPYSLSKAVSSLNVWTLLKSFELIIINQYSSQTRAFIENKIRRAFCKPFYVVQRENMQFLFEVAIKKPTLFRVQNAHPPEPCHWRDTMTAQPVHVQCHQSIQPSFNFCLVIINSSFLMTFSSQPLAKASR